ncbi:uncharacterized protein MELLADRAFT_92471 [Melampsora larici-populina 98AG31]|uniref:Uncharacterized protein n=1 Tax=Melampsora larici-populina (strain 98AG31 / pathotype 3-4-7) TaxID=747676 RepID=F4R8K4_MELLP|nr:uncharacterized protein MELLADRAFT_92471 [Melampsora larici-populina 98AG31]EGG11035.1 hypothetical protein MELLADRAFT_92471 [Melampsora larici-populina 98AG31]
MSNPIQFCVFLPSYLLRYVVDGIRPSIDPELFLRTAATTEILETILAFYPHFRFTPNAQQDRDLLQKMFIGMVAPRLSNIIIPTQRVPNYTQASSPTPISESPEFTTTVDSVDDIDVNRMAMFNNFCLTYLKNGQYRLAAEYLNRFLDTYEFLNQEEINVIMEAQAGAEEAFHDSSCYLQDCHQSIEGIQLQLRQNNLSPTERQVLEERQKTMIISLRSNQRLFSNSIQDVGFVAALAEYHKNILASRQPDPSK